MLTQQTNLILEKNKKKQKQLQIIKNENKENLRDNKNRTLIATYEKCEQRNVPIESEIRTKETKSIKPENKENQI